MAFLTSTQVIISKSTFDWATAAQQSKQKATERFIEQSIPQMWLGLHVLPADLQIEAVGIFHVETVFGIGTRFEAAALQFRFHRVLVPVVDGVGDVVDQ